MRPLYGHSDEVCDFVARLIPGLERGLPDNSTGIGFLDGERLVAGVVFHDWNPDWGVVEFTGASVSPKWLPRGVLRFLGEYVFDDLGCQMLTARTSEKNDRINSILERTGFRPHRVERGRGRHEAEIYWTLTDTDWRQSRLAR